MLKSRVALLVLLATALPAAADEPARPAEPPRAGLVTAIQGNATVSRRTLASPAFLKFQDPIFLRDRIATMDEALVRLLVGEKAVVTIRERSVVVITEIPGVSTVDVGSGKVAVAVAREKLQSGELVEIRTPNAIAGVRGTVVLAEVSPPGAGPTRSTFTVLSGSVHIVHFDPVSKRPLAPPVALGANQRLAVAGATAPKTPPKPQTISPAAASQAGRDFRMTTGNAPVPLGGAILQQEVAKVAPRAAAGVTAGPGAATASKAVSGAAGPAAAVTGVGAAAGAAVAGGTAGGAASGVATGLGVTPGGTAGGAVGGATSKTTGGVVVSPGVALNPQGRRVGEGASKASPASKTVLTKVDPAKPCKDESPTPAAKAAAPPAGAKAVTHKVGASTSVGAPAAPPCKDEPGKAAGAQKKIEALKLAVPKKPALQSPTTK
ncbi:MAG: FecR domain-containing protein [Candidatus Rokubacteria bacterium]|nr:FecR domain-containing protein [Candidatus Rokubacteria bacterium]